MDSRAMASLLTFLFLSSLLLPDNNNLCEATRKLTALYHPPPLSLTYHNGALLEGNVAVSILWYGRFTPSQKSTISDFLLSLTPAPTTAFHPPSSKHPSVSKWWNLVQTYVKRAGKRETRVVLSSQSSDENCSLGKLLKRSHITHLAGKAAKPGGGLTLILTAEDVAVEGFCMSNCGFHGSSSGPPKSAFIWVGDSATQCPGQCAWPFHQPVYGPQTKPLVAPNGDVGVDGMVVNIASLLAGAVTNPFGRGYYLSSSGAPRLEAASACTGVYGKGAYPGYAGEVLEDPSTGGSYNAVGVNGRKYLLPALFDPLTSRCSTLL